MQGGTDATDEGKDVSGVLKWELCLFSFEAGLLPLHKCQAA